MTQSSANPYALYTAIRVAPLLVLPLILFILCALSAGENWTTAVALAPDMMSGATWAISYGDLFVLGSLVVLFVEIVKSVHTDASDIINHGLSMLVAITCLILFVTTSPFTNSTFFILTAMAFIDVVAGFAITIVAARRDIGTQAH